MINSDILDIALRQSAIDANCAPDDFLRSENVIVTSAKDPAARRYLTLPFACNLISYGNNIVASVNDTCREIVRSYLAAHTATPYAALETPFIYRLNTALQQHGLTVCFMAEYFLPDLNALCAPACGYALRVLTPADLALLYLPQWSNALCKDRSQLDVLGVGAYRGETLIGLAACSADCDDMWQIGVDVLPDERRQGIAAALTGRLAKEILDRDKVPFYCCAWSNIRSARTALRCGFRPAWVEVSVKPKAFVDDLDRGHWPSDAVPGIICE